MCVVGFFEREEDEMSREDILDVIALMPNAAIMSIVGIGEFGGGTTKGRD